MIPSLQRALPLFDFNDKNEKKAFRRFLDAPK